MCSIHHFLHFLNTYSKGCIELYCCCSVPVIIGCTIKAFYTDNTQGFFFYILYHCVETGVCPCCRVKHFKIGNWIKCLYDSNLVRKDELHHTWQSASFFPWETGSFSLLVIFTKQNDIQQPLSQEPLSKQFWMCFWYNILMCGGGLNLPNSNTIRDTTKVWIYASETHSKRPFVLKSNCCCHTDATTNPIIFVVQATTAMWICTSEMAMDSMIWRVLCERQGDEITTQSSCLCCANLVEMQCHKCILIWVQGK